MNLLIESLEFLWLSFYGLIAGWGISVVLTVSALVFLLVRTINLQRRLDSLENRVVTNEREFNLTTKTWPGKK